MIDFQDWPAPEQPGQKLYVAAGTLDSKPVLQAAGWLVVDVRTLPNHSDAARAESLRCWLEGLRVGSIESNNALLKVLELEAKTLGVLNTKTASDSSKTKTQELDPLEALNFKSARAFKGTYLEGAENAAGKRAGRPRGTTDSAPRKRPGGLQVVPDEPPTSPDVVL